MRSCRAGTFTIALIYVYYHRQLIFPTNTISFLPHRLMKMNNIVCAQLLTVAAMLFSLAEGSVSAQIITDVKTIDAGSNARNADSVITEAKRFLPSFFDHHHHDDDKRMAIGYNDDKRFLPGAFGGEDKRMAANYFDKRMAANYFDKRMAANYFDKRFLPAAFEPEQKRMAANYFDKRMAANYFDKRMAANYFDKRMATPYFEKRFLPAEYFE